MPRSWWSRYWPDVLLVAGASGFAMLSAVLGLPGDGAHPVVRVALLAAAAGALAAVRRAPLAVLVVEGAVLVVTDTLAPFSTDAAQGCTALALAVVAYRSGWAATAAGWALTFATAIVNVLDVGNGHVLAGPAGALRLLGLAGLAAAPIAFGRYVRGVRQAAVVAEERAREVEARRVVETRAARLAERTRIARDLHDIVAHHVAAIALQAGAAQYAAGVGRVDEAVATLGSVRATAGRVLDELRELLDILRDPDAVGHSAPVVEPEQMIEDAVRATNEAGLAVAVTLPPPVGSAPLVVRTTAARVVQEGLTNALKHAGPGARVAVRLLPDDRYLHVEVVDSGPVGHRRPAALPDSGHGLTGMRERVSLLGGELTARPAGDGGWLLHARLPLREAT